MQRNYKLTLNDIDKKGNIEKLKRDGFTNEQIHKTMYRETEGASTREREKIMNKLHERG